MLRLSQMLHWEFQMLSEAKQKEVSQETECVCLCGTDLAGNRPAQFPGWEQHSSSTCVTRYLGWSWAGNRHLLAQAFCHTGGCPALQKQGEFMPLPVHVQGYWFNAVSHFGKQCFSKGGKMLALWEGILLANKHWISSFYFTRDLYKKIRLEGGSLEWFWEALTQKRANDSYYYCYLLRRTDHEPDLLLIFGNLKHLCSDPERVCGFWTKVFQHKS